MSKPSIDPEILENGEAKWKYHKDVCASIVTELRGYPCSYLFEEPRECKIVDQGKVLSFQIILDNINNGVYTQLKDWVLDMKLLLTTGFKVHKRPSEFAICYDFVQRFMKKSRRLNLTSLRSWSKTIMAYKLKIDSLLQTSPPAARKYFPTTIPQIEYTTKKIGLPQIEFIKKNSLELQDPNDIHSLLNIIRLDVNSVEPQNGLLDIDLCTLSMPTRCKIYDFMRSRIKENDQDHAL
ncbi:Histidine-containing phosphotransfer protein 3 [Tritrichomonas musculus]|uniref:Histidine-containing phosphotransfer protein 3 n=1 Tax=Tritrichomonas musculus TaxID=1915356 RepID=A0ABR2KCH6_9EUKA